MVKQS